MPDRTKLNYYHRRPFVTYDNIDVVLQRLPQELLSRLKTVRFTDRAQGNRVLGYVTQGRRDVCLCLLPPHVSLTRACRVCSVDPEEFGALRDCQWPFLAVRRFILYDVLLHELGHLQIVDPSAKSNRRKFAHENRAQEFANQWRNLLWSNHFNHPDPAHNPPSSDELELTRKYWTEAHAQHKRGVAFIRNAEFENAFRCFKQATDLYQHHSMAFEQLGICYVFGLGTERSPKLAREAFQQALMIDPDLRYARTYLRRV